MQCPTVTLVYVLRAHIYALDQCVYPYHTHTKRKHTQTLCNNHVTDSDSASRTNFLCRFRIRLHDDSTEELLTDKANNRHAARMRSMVINSSCTQPYRSIDVLNDQPLLPSMKSNRIVLSDAAFSLVKSCVVVRCSVHVLMCGDDDDHHQYEYDECACGGWVPVSAARTE